jgi:hypothetical protein
MPQTMQLMTHCPIKWMESATTPSGARTSFSLSNTRTHIHLDTLRVAIWQYFAKLRGTYANFGTYWTYISCLNWFIYQNSFTTFARILYFVQQMTWFNNKCAHLKNVSLLFCLWDVAKNNNQSKYMWHWKLKYLRTYRFKHHHTGLVAVNNATANGQGSSILRIPSSFTNMEFTNSIPTSLRPHLYFSLVIFPTSFHTTNSMTAGLKSISETCSVSISIHVVSKSQSLVYTHFVS